MSEITRQEFLTLSNKVDLILQRLDAISGFIAAHNYNGTTVTHHPNGIPATLNGHTIIQPTAVPLSIVPQTAPNALITTMPPTLPPPLPACAPPPVLQPTASVDHLTHGNMVNNIQESPRERKAHRQDSRLHRIISVEDESRNQTPTNSAGQINIPLGRVDLAQVVEETRDIEEPPKDVLGDICLSLRYVPQKSQLTIVIMECKNLKKMDIGGLSDPYVKIAVMQNGKRIKKSKTTIKMHTLNPYFNESFKFEVAPQIVNQLQVWLTVVDYDRVGSNDVIGRVILGCNTGGSPQKHWTDVVANPRRSIAQWHTLTLVKEDKK